MQFGSPIDVYRYPRSFKAADLLSDPGINRLGERDAVRPEHISLEPKDGLSLAATISGVETNGAETYLYAEVVLEKVAFEWVVKLRGMKDVHEGQQLTLYIRQEDVLSFDNEGSNLG